MGEKVMCSDPEGGTQSGGALDVIVGEFLTSFGLTILEGDYSDVNNLDNDKLAAFLHERIHYIQQFGTLYGVNRSIYNLSIYAEKIRYIHTGKFVKYIQNTDMKDLICASFETVQGDSFDLDGNAISCHSIQRISFDNMDKELVQDIFSGIDCYFEEQIKLHYHDTKSYLFGGEAICESMAYLFEKYFFNSNDYPHALPYCSIEMLYEFVVGQRCNNIPVLIALAYASLMHRSPANRFYELLLMIKENSEPQSMNEVFKMASLFMRKVSDEQLSLLEERIDWVLPIENDKEILESFANKQAEQLAYCNRWLKERYRFISTNEENFRNALVCVLEEREEKKRMIAMGNLLNEYGQLTVIDNTGKVYCDENIQLQFLLAPCAVYRIIMEEKSDCLMLNTCKEYNLPYREECQTKCWEIPENVPPYLCALRFYMYEIGLGGIRFELLENSPFASKK